MRDSLMLAALTLPFMNTAAAEEAVTTLDPVVVTATRTPEPETATLAAVTVIDRAEIERRQARSVPDVLRGLPGFNVSANGGAGQPASVFLRGTDADHILVLVDGIKVGSATLGIVPWQDLPIAQIERIEVVRGPRSSLYGSEAIGGVIQIFTRRGGGPLSPRFSLGAGSFGTASVSGGISGGGEQGWFNLSGNFDQTEGINACDGRPAPYAGCGVIQPDRDGYRNLGVSLRGGYQFGELAKLDVHLLQSENRTDFDGSLFSGSLSRSGQQVLGAKAMFNPLERWTLTLAGGRSWDNYRAFYQDAALGIPEHLIGRFETERDSLSLQSDLAMTPGHLATLGIDYLNDRVSGTVDYTEDARDNLGVFGEYQGSVGPAEVKLSLRQDDNQQFGTHATGNAALGYRFGDALRLSLSYGTAFKAPTFNDLYYPGFGNPDLAPEQSRSLELGLTGVLPVGTGPAGSWDLRLYQTEIDDLIAFDAVTFAAANIDSALILGLEASARVQILDWNLGANLTLLDPENRSEGPEEGNLLPRRPEQAFQLDLDRQFARWSAGATLYIAGRRFDDLANRVWLEGYTLVDLRAEYAFSPSVRVQARLENVFDEDYETAYLYNQPGRALYLTLRYEP